MHDGGVRRGRRGSREGATYALRRECRRAGSSRCGSVGPCLPAVGQGVGSRVVVTALQATLVGRRIQGLGDLSVKLHLVVDLY